MFGKTRALFFLILVTAASSPAASIGNTAATPTSVSVGVATTVTITSLITDASLISSSVILQSLNSSGQVIAILGTLHDDGINGDTQANDRTYTLQTTVYQTTSGSVRLRVSAAFQGSVLRVSSAPMTINVTGASVGINILWPANLLYTGLTTVNVTGTVGDPNATVTVNGVNAPVTNGQFAAQVPLVEGLNTLTAVATNSGPSQTTASVQVTLDTTPPHLTIDSPGSNTTTTAPSISVTGTANDVVVGTVNNADVQVTVNGIAAQVANRTYSARNIALAVGPNTIQAVGRDRAGNGATVTTTITRTLPSQPPVPAIGAAVITNSLSIVSGDGQTGGIGTTLGTPLVVSLTNPAGSPVANQPVLFSVTGNDGTVSAGGVASAAVTVNTGPNGQAQVSWTLGQRAGAGINTVQASSPLAVGPVNLSATGSVSKPAQIVVDSGDNQTGALSQALVFPFVAVVIDSGHNRVPNVPVTFTVMQGGGTLAGGLSQTATTDSNGRAIAVLTLGSQPGNSNNIVQASFSGNTGQPATFTASAKTPGSPANTTISGVVLDNSNNPIPGTTIRLFLTNQASNNNLPVQIGTPVQTDAQGTFLIRQAPVGFFKLMADGSTAPGPKAYPTLEYDLVTVAGQDNTVGVPIYLPALDKVNQLCVDASHGGTLTLPQAPGFSLTVLPGSATFPGGSRTGCISVTPVNGDKVPMAPGFGQQPRFIVTIQPVGTTFNPPAPITMPNADGLKPKAVTEMYSYDHDLSEFIAIGTGTVSNDGSVIASNPGVGVLKAGWHCGGNPNVPGSGEVVHVQIVSPAKPQLMLLQDGTVTVTADGGPLENPPGTYSWTSSDSGVAAIQGSATSKNVVVKGTSAGTAKLTVRFTCSSVDSNNVHPFAEDSILINVVKLTIDINNTPTNSDDITALNPLQLIPARITLQGASGAVQLSVVPAGRASLDRVSLNLTAGTPDTILITPLQLSAAANDVQIVATFMGTTAATAHMTIVNIVFPPHIRASDTPAQMSADRIPPTAFTPVIVTLQPNLSASGQSVRLVPLNNNAVNGDFLINGQASLDLVMTTTVVLVGTTQTAPTGGLGGGFAGNLVIAAMVRGQITAISTGFSVAAMPSGIIETLDGVDGKVTVCSSGAACFGLALDLQFTSDSGDVTDLDQVDFSEQVENLPGTGGLAGFTSIRQTEYKPILASPGYLDSHDTPVHPWTDVPGILLTKQTHTFRDRRTGVTDIPIPNSGYLINRNVFPTPSPGTGFSLTTSKVGAAGTANGFTSTAGAPLSTLSVTQP